MVPPTCKNSVWFVQLVIFSVSLFGGGSFAVDFGSISGASRFFFVDEAFQFKGPGTETCGSEIPNASGGEPPRFPLDFPESHASGINLFLPALKLLDASTETTIAIQNVGDASAVPLIFLLDEDGGAVLAECGGFLEPGSAFTLQPSLIPDDATAAVIVSFPADFVGGGSDIVDLCAYFTDIAIQKQLSKGIGSIFSTGGPNLAIQVQRRPLGQPGDTPLVSTQYTAISERMFDILQFDGTVEDGPFRYELSHVFSGEDTDTEVHVLPIVLSQGTSSKGLSESFSSVFTDQVTGATTAGPSGDILPGRTMAFRISDYVGNSFSGSWVVDSSQPLAIVADYSYPGYRYSSVLGARTRPIGGGFRPDSRSAWAPIIQEEGWETEITLYNADTNDINTLTIELKDSLGNNLDQRQVILDPSDHESLTFSPSLFDPESNAGVVFIVGDQSFIGVVHQVKRDTSGDVVDVLSYNLLEEDVTVGNGTFLTSSKGFTADEEGGADVLALPLMGKADPGSGRETEILLTNLNSLPGLTSVNLYLYDNAGLRDIQCVILRPLETLRIPVDFPSLSPGAIASLIIRGASTSQKVRRSNGDIFNTFALAAIAVEHTTSPPPSAPDNQVVLAEGGNDAAMANAAVFLPIATAANGDMLFFPMLNQNGTVAGASDTLEVLTIDNCTTLKAGVVFLALDEIVGVTVSDAFSFGEKWSFQDSSIPSDAVSAVMFSLDPNDVTAENRLLNLTTLSEYAQFARDYGNLSGILPTFSLFGLSHRESSSAGQSDKRVLASYEAHRRRDLGREDRVFGGLNTLIPLVLTGEGFDTVVAIQNAGILATGVELMFVSEGTPQQEPSIKHLDSRKLRSKGMVAKTTAGGSGPFIRFDILEPGTSIVFHPADYVGKDFRGQVFIRSTQPVVALVDLETGGTLSSYRSIPDELVDGELGTDPYFTRGSDVAYAPLTYPSEEGWETVVQVLNLNRLIDAKIRIDYYSPSGTNIHTQTGFVPPGGVAAFRRSATEFNLTDNPSEVDWVQITSEDYWREGSSPVPAPNIAGVIQLTKKNEEGCILESVAYNTYRERGVFNYPGETFPFPRQLALLSVFKDFGNTGVSTEISLVNLNPNSGTTTLTDVNFQGDGFTTSLADITLNPRQSHFLRTLDSPGIPSGVEGSLSLAANLGNSFQEGGPGIAAIAVHRGYGLLPNEECGVQPPTETATPSPTVTASQEPTETLTPTVTPTGTVPTPTVTPTASDTPDQGELMRADVNQDRRVDTQDILIILKNYLLTY